MDAGWSPPLRRPLSAGPTDVTFEVFAEGQRLVGERVELQGPTGTEGRPTDVMGLARLTLQEGTWTVTRPRLARPLVLEVRGAARQVRLDVPPQLSIFGVVRDPSGAAVGDAQLTAKGLESGTVHSTVSDSVTGRFELPVLEPRSWLSATAGPLRSDDHFVHAPAQGVVVTVFPRVKLRVKVWSPGEDEPPAVLVTHQGRLVAEGRGRAPVFDAPAGLLAVSARQSFRGLSWQAREDVTTSLDGRNLVEVRLRPVQPLRGTVRDAAGHGLGGLTVRAQAAPESPRTADVLLDAGSPGGWAMTGGSGAFALRLGEPVPLGLVYELTVDGLWRSVRRVLVEPGDAPVELEVEPVTAP